jgi:membrane protease YdiL (CAAX protease family)
MATYYLQHPPRSGAFGAAIIFVDVFLLSVFPFSSTIDTWMVLTALTLITAAVLARNLQSLHFSIFTAALITAPYVNPSLRSWPFTLLFPLLCYGIIVAISPNLRKSVFWIRRGVPDKTAIIVTAITSVTAGIALVLWYVLIKPSLDVHLKHMRFIPIWLFPVGGIAFAFGNATVEEFTFRGVIMQALDSAAGPSFISLFVQAWLFGAMHYLHGFPNGLSGVAMTVTYGIILGWLRRRSRGMLTPWLAHVCADIVIFMILTWIMLEGPGAR